MGGGLEDTICAIATPLGEGGIGILRISGSQAIETVSPLVRLKSGKPLAAVRSHHLYLADIVGPSAGRSGRSGFPRDSINHGQIIEESLVVVMRGPRSFTGEHVVEIHCHGGPLVLQTVCEACLSRGARLAEPGEFTKRAFLNGRLDLTQAEAVLDTIRAKTEMSLKLAQQQLRGGVSTEISRIRESLLNVLARVEAAIDFAEEDITFVGHGELLALIRETKEQVNQLIQTSQEGRILREGATVTIAGKPNVGKSSLMNALLRMDRAIVTPIPGTTRDVLEDFINLRGVPVRLRDTAGIRETGDPVELEGIRRSHEARREADLILVLLNGAEPLTVEDEVVLSSLGDTKCVIVMNKTDLPLQWEMAAVSEMVPPESSVEMRPVSAKTGAGIEELRDTIRSLLISGHPEAHEGAVISHVRHLTALRRAHEGLEHAGVSVADRLPGEVVATDLRLAADALGEISGEISTDDVLDRIFSEFCIGK